MAESRRAGSFLINARVYLSGPMDFVASRTDEKRSGWRVRVGEVLRSLGATVFDPWSKPDILGLHEYGREDEITIEARKKWTFEPTPTGAKARALCSDKFWETMHVDLRMVDVSDFVIAYCPTNIYSVGTPHEIIVARQQHKPVLFVSPPVEFPVLDKLRSHLSELGDSIGQNYLDELVQQVPIKPNPRGIPSLWYMPLIGGEKFFDGFGFNEYCKKFDWSSSHWDDRERQQPPSRPLLPFLFELNHKLPQRWDNRSNQFVKDDDWLLLDFDRETVH